MVASQIHTGVHIGISAVLILRTLVGSVSSWFINDKFNIRQSIFFSLFADSVHQTVFSAISLGGYFGIIASQIWDFDQGIPTQIFFLSNYSSVIFSPIFSACIPCIRFYVQRNIQTTVKEAFVQLVILAFYIAAIVNAILYGYSADWGRGVRQYIYVISGASEIEPVPWSNIVKPEFGWKLVFGIIVPVLFSLGSLVVHWLSYREYQKVPDDQSSFNAITACTESYLLTFKHLTYRSTLYIGLTTLPFFAILILINESWNRHPDSAFFAVNVAYALFSGCRTPLMLFLNFNAGQRATRSARQRQQNSFAMERRQEERRAKFLKAIGGPAEGFGPNETRRTSLRRTERKERRASQPGPIDERFVMSFLDFRSHTTEDVFLFLSLQICCQWCVMINSQISVFLDF